ncbi:hypothetical protein [Gorillibacterium sp. CAU 1737]|uniref:hypothetical protein n=1 Tax=Gorillibacterium sp. CAU 1737 TaxID=3140362 RepID=UPI00326085FD
MTDIYDFFSRRNLRKLVQNSYEENAQLIEEKGRYIGVLTKTKTQSIRITIHMMDIKRGQIENLMNDFQQLCTEYEQMAEAAIKFLKVHKNRVEYNSEEYDLYVDQDGHCWVAKKED